ncbi:MAG: tetratricopeptide repeat protein [Thermoguttaceae bacterium]
MGMILCISGCTTYNQSAEGMKLFSEGKYDQAMGVFQASLASDPNNPDTYYNIGATYHQSAKIVLQQGDSAKAKPLFDQADQYYRLCLTKNPNHVAAYRGLAVLYMECQNPEAAFNLLINWRNSNPNAVDPKLELARLYQEYYEICAVQGRKEDAEKCYAMTVQLLNEVLASDPTNYRALRALGYLSEKRGEIVAAIDFYRRSLASDANQPDLVGRVNLLSQGAGISGNYYPSSSGGATIFPGR